MTSEQKQCHIKKILLLSDSKTVTDEEHITTKLSVQPDECPQFLTTMPQYLIDEIWQKVEKILSHGKITDIDEKSCCVIFKTEAFVVTFKSGNFQYNCELFQTVKSCGHPLASADNRSSVHQLLKRGLVGWSEGAA